MRDLRSSTVTSRVRCALVVAALLGMLSMHGWGAHAGTHAEPGLTAAHTAIQHGDAPDDGGMGGLVGLCLAVLGGLVLAFAHVLRRRGVPLLRTMLPAFRHPVLLGRDRDPPDLLRLGVIRC